MVEARASQGWRLDGDEEGLGQEQTLRRLILLCTVISFFFFLTPLDVLTNRCFN